MRDRMAMHFMSNGNPFVCHDDVPMCPAMSGATTGIPRPLDGVDEQFDSSLRGF